MICRVCGTISLSMKLCNPGLFQSDLIAVCLSL